LKSVWSSHEKGAFAKKKNIIFFHFFCSFFYLPFLSFCRRQRKIVSSFIFTPSFLLTFFSLFSYSLSFFFSSNFLLFLFFLSLSTHFIKFILFLFSLSSLFFLTFFYFLFLITISSVSFSLFFLFFLSWNCICTHLTK
jgi:hypothetical protein